MRYRYSFHATPEEACAWVVRRMQNCPSIPSQMMLSDLEVQALLVPMPVAFAQISREDLTVLNNRSVHLLRATLTLFSSAEFRYELTGISKSPGLSGVAPAPLVKMRRGLKIPADWAETFDLIVRSNVPLVVSGVVQNAINVNPLAGETSPWEMPLYLGGYL